MGSKGARYLNLLLLLLAGIVIGGFLGEYLGTMPYFTWLRFGDSFGMSSPLVLDLGILHLTLGFSMTINIAGIIGIIIAIIAFRKL